MRGNSREKASCKREERREHEDEGVRNREN